MKIIAKKSRSKFLAEVDEYEVKRIAGGRFIAGDTHIEVGTEVDVHAIYKKIDEMARMESTLNDLIKGYERAIEALRMDIEAVKMLDIR